MTTSFQIPSNSSVILPFIAGFNLVMLAAYSRSGVPLEPEQALKFIINTKIFLNNVFHGIKI
jgi:hypothetical protein